VKNNIERGRERERGLDKRRDREPAPPRQKKKKRKKRLLLLTEADLVLAVVLVAAGRACHVPELLAPGAAACVWF
jgi:hypothetical protein